MKGETSAFEMQQKVHEPDSISFYKGPLFVIVRRGTAEPADAQAFARALERKPHGRAVEGTTRRPVTAKRRIAGRAARTTPASGTGREDCRRRTARRPGERWPGSQRERQGSSATRRHRRECRSPDGGGRSRGGASPSRPVPMHRRNSGARPFLDNSSGSPGKSRNESAIVIAGHQHHAGTRQRACERSARCGGARRRCGLRRMHQVADDGKALPAAVRRSAPRVCARRRLRQPAQVRRGGAAPRRSRDACRRRERCAIAGSHRAPEAWAKRPGAISTSRDTRRLPFLIQPARPAHRGRARGPAARASRG